MDCNGGWGANGSLFIGKKCLAKKSMVMKGTYCCDSCDEIAATVMIVM